MTSKHWKQFYALIKASLGICLTPEHEKLLMARLSQLVKKYALNSWEEFLEVLVNNPSEGMWDEFVEGIVFRPVGFFRENRYFEYVVEHIQMILEENKRIRQNGELRVWSVGCSTGEEPYALAIILRECLPPTVQIKILATDIHTGSLIAASNGLFGSEIKADVSPYLLEKYFKAAPDGYEIKPEIKRLVTFRLFNLLHRYSFRSDFDIVFCQNGLVYYDNAMRRHLLEKFYQVLHAGGLLLAGHSENLVDSEDRFRHLEPAVYLK